MTKDKAYYLERFRREPLTVAPGQDFTVRPFQPGDELGIARLYHAVYGEEYPFEQYYIPERILRLNLDHDLCSVVSRATDGSIVGHWALFRSSPPYPRLMEVGQGLVLSNYRKSGMASLMNDCTHRVVAPRAPADGIFGEAVTNHTVTQVFDVAASMTDYAVELGLLPPGSGREGARGRVSCVIQFVTLQDREHTVHVPRCYEKEIEFLVSDADFKRCYRTSRKPLPADRQTRHQVTAFPQARTTRFTFFELGGDFPAAIGRLEEQARRDGFVTLQSFLNLGEEAVGAAVDVLRERGWLLGGYLPRWFDTDGLLLQKIEEPPDFDSIKLYSRKAKDILEMVRASGVGPRQPSDSTR